MLTLDSRVQSVRSSGGEYANIGPGSPSESMLQGMRRGCRVDSRYYAFNPGGILIMKFIDRRSDAQNEPEL